VNACKFRYSIFLLTAIIAFGTFGYSIFEDMPLFDAFYMTIITISTVGFSEIRPLTVVDFIDITTMKNQLGLIMEEALIDSKSRFTGKNLIDSRLRQDFGVIIVAIKKLSSEMIFNPMPLETLEAGDVIVLIGKKDDLKRMNEIL